jgi:hypothetical protein
VEVSSHGLICLEGLTAPTNILRIAGFWAHSLFTLIHSVVSALLLTSVIDIKVAEQVLLVFE